MDEKKNSILNAFENKYDIIKIIRLDMKLLSDEERNE